MDSILEEKRTLHEEQNRLELAIVDEILSKKTGHRDKLDSEHRQRVLLDRYMKCSKILKLLYEKPEPISTEDNETKSSSNTFKEFYLALKEVKELPSAPPVEVASPEIQVEFSDEEGYGRYLDLTKCHEAFLQVIRKKTVKPNYLTFLDQFDNFGSLDRDSKLTRDYKTYIEMLYNYFRDYCKRAKPLFDSNDMEEKVHEKFSKQWTEKSIPDWFTESDRSESNPMVDLDSYRSHEELVELGLDCLKQELQARGLKCGGTLEERAKRLWSVKGKEAHEIDNSLRAGAVISKKKTTIEPFTIALIEAKLAVYAEHFNDHRQATIENVQRKQARTAEERVDSDEDISDVEEDDDDQSDVIYNPKSLPMGWDGKPIPYWLYKLHGLNLTFTCEICGNATYKGPKTFQRHFAEWRHAHGMRCLDIPNTAHFANITQIKDAVTLWNKLKNEKQKDHFQPLNDEEYEDSKGNVLTKKTYEDLKRQGLL